jgi:hypothetical protein
MVHRLRQILRSGLGLAVYLACTALVVSFILFEVLDVDGSSFPPRPGAAATRVDPGETDNALRRALLRTTGPIWADPVAPLCDPAGGAPRALRTVPRVHLCPAAPMPGDHAAFLPRSALPDPLPPTC